MSENQEELVRVMRVIIYEGPRKWVENTIAKSIKGTRNVSTNGKITAQTINEFPEIIAQHEKPISQLDR